MVLFPPDMNCRGGIEQPFEVLVGCAPVGVLVQFDAWVMVAILAVIIRIIAGVSPPLLALARNLSI